MLQRRRSPFPCVTVIADASFCRETKAAGYAVWIKGNGQTTRHTGLFKTAVQSASDAETRALANGIILAIAKHSLSAGSIIVAQTDCMRAIHLLDGRARKMKPHEAEAVKAVRAALLTPAGAIDLRIKHVRGHQGNVTPRNAVNEWCDREAKAAMRGMRAAAMEIA